MKITLKQWKDLERKVAALSRAMRECETEFLCLAIDHKRQENSEEMEFLAEWANVLTAAAETIPSPSSFHPQSEWVGGDSDNPQNHRLKEPHATGKYLKRYFTPEEIREAGGVCHGPCQWEFSSDR